MNCSVKESPAASYTIDQPYETAVCFTSETGLVDLETVQRLGSNTSLMVSEEQLQAIEDQIDTEEGMEMLKEEGGTNVDDLRKELGL